MCAPAHSRAHNRTKIVKFSESAKREGSLGWGRVIGKIGTIGRIGRIGKIGKIGKIGL
jgi:hypothetical protein